MGDEAALEVRLRRCGFHVAIFSYPSLRCSLSQSALQLSRFAAGIASGDSDAGKRAAKARIFGELRQEFARIKAADGGFSRYDRWFVQRINNAHLASVATYTQLVPAFRTLLAQQNGAMGRFYEVVRELGRQPQAERTSRLQSAGLARME